ncbi:MAG: Hsp20/alpha crystallin family protein [Rubrivivax sp.]|jgi:HSP20 family protein|nr:Hsp20/alpha crystallin family protein [Rubrivivax sp.]
MFASPFLSRDVFTEFDRLQRELQNVFDSGSDARGPALNASTTADAVDVQLLVPGVDPASFDVQIEGGVLTVAGERPAPGRGAEERAAVRQQERFFGKFRRALRLPEDANADDVQASYREGVLHVRVARRVPVPARRITVQ